MKQIFCVALMLSAIFGFNSKLTAQEKNDTIVKFNKKTVQIEDSVGQVKVKVFDANGEPYTKVYEGVFTDGKSYEKWTVSQELGLDIPLIGKMIHPKKKKQSGMEAHWAGIGWGFTNVADKNIRINDVDGVSLDTRNSVEFYLNLIEKIVPVYRNVFGLTTGFGMGWHTYYLADNAQFVENNGVTSVQPVADKKFDYSRLRTFQLTVPILLEWQPNFGNNHKFYMAGGLIGSVNTMASFKVKYQNDEGDWVKKVYGKGMNVLPVSADVMLQAGYNSFGVFAKYGLIGLFENGKGPDVRSISIGAVLNF